MWTQALEIEIDVKAAKLLQDQVTRQIGPADVFPVAVEKGSPGGRLLRDEALEIRVGPQPVFEVRVHLAPTRLPVQERRWHIGGLPELVNDLGNHVAEIFCRSEIEKRLWAASKSRRSRMSRPTAAGLNASAMVARALSPTLRARSGFSKTALI